MEKWEKEISRLYEQYMDSNEEMEFADYIDKYASPEYLEMSRKEHERLDALHKKGIYE